MLEAFERIQPGLADRLVRMAEKELDHSHETKRQELAIVERQQNIIGRAQITGATLSGIGLVAGTILILCGASPYGVAFLLTNAFATFVATIVNRSKEASTPKQLRAPSDTDQGSGRKAVVPVKRKRKR
jgi:uncharacterized membrane protein